MRLIVRITTALLATAMASNLAIAQAPAINDEPLTGKWSPLKMKGATGSPGNPVALY